MRWIRAAAAVMLSNFNPAGRRKSCLAVFTALEAAGVAESDVIFEKKGTSFDDGREIYEIDFRAKDGMEYEYDFRVADGTMLDKNVDMDDWDD